MKTRKQREKEDVVPLRQRGSQGSASRRYARRSPSPPPLLPSSRRQSPAKRHSGASTTNAMEQGDKEDPDEVTSKPRSDHEKSSEDPQEGTGERAQEEPNSSTDLPPIAGAKLALHVALGTPSVQEKGKKKVPEDEPEDGYHTDSGNEISPVQDHESPVKEITFSIDDNNKNDDMQHDQNNVQKPRRSSLSSSHKKVRKAPMDLDEDTFKIVKDYLISKSKHLLNSTPLNDDDITQFMVRLHNLSNRQAMYQHNLFASSATTAYDSSDEHDVNNHDNHTNEQDEQIMYSLFREILAEEKEHAIGHELFKTMVANIQKDQQQQQSSSDNILDKRTLNWIKRAAGLNRSTAAQARRNAIHNRQQVSFGGNGSDDSETGVGIGHRASSRILGIKTRTAARQSRLERRQRGLLVLVQGLDELEQEFGPFTRKKRKKPDANNNNNNNNTQQQQRDPYQADDDESRTNSNDSNNKNNNSRKKPRLVAEIRKRKVVMKASSSTSTGNKQQRHALVEEATQEIVVSRIWLDNGIAYDDGYQSHKPVNHLNDRNNDDAQKSGARTAERPTKSTTSNGSRNNKDVGYNTKDPPCPRTLAWENSSLSRSQHERQQQSSSHEQQQTRSGYLKTIADNARSYKQAGIPCHLPDWKTVNNNHRTSQSGPPPRCRHSNAVCASFCSKLMNALSGPARSWATCEFFYSDLDRAWYNRNTFMEDIAKLGINPNTRLTHREWKAIRRRILARRKPRRFSKRFIASQLNERNAYRNRVRMLQHVPALASTTADFSYNVPARIPLRTTVTAYSRRFRMIQRGVVLSRDDLSARYLVLFESEEFGSEYCPDSLVASHGGPEIVKVLGAETYLSSTFDQAEEESGALLSFASRDGSSAGPQPAEYFSVRDELAKALLFSPITFNKKSSAAGEAVGIKDRPSNTFENVRNEVAEREMLVLLVRVAAAATRRKEALLSELEKVAAALELNASDESSFSLSSQLKDTYSWWWASLEETNQTLNLALRYIRLMYGKVYLPATYESPPTKEEFVETALSSVLSARDPLPEAALDWAAQLASDAGDVSDRLVSLIAPPEKETKNNKGASKRERSLAMTDRLCAVGQLLFSASCVQGMAMASSGNDHLTSVAALAPGASKLFCLPDEIMPDGTSAGVEDLYTEVKAARDQAVADLRDALDLFQTEVAVASARHKLFVK